LNLPVHDSLFALCLISPCFPSETVGVSVACRHAHVHVRAIKGIPIQSRKDC
jgi:hypothetical protein